MFNIASIQVDKFFQKDVDTTNRNAMEDFLRNHERYLTLNEINDRTSYANRFCPDTMNLPTPAATPAGANRHATAHEVLSRAVLCEDWTDAFLSVTGAFLTQQNSMYHIGFNGSPNNRYLVLYLMESKPDPDDTGKTLNVINPSEGLDDNLDNFLFMDDDELKERVELVKNFDHACDILRSCLVYILTHYTVKSDMTLTEP